MSAKISIPSGSLEYVKATVTADVTLADAMTVAISLSSNGVHNWVTATWTGTAAVTRTARTSSPVDFSTLTKGKTYSVYVKLTDSPEVPIIAAGSLTVS